MIIRGLHEEVFRQWKTNSPLNLFNPITNEITFDIH